MNFHTFNYNRAEVCVCISIASLLTNEMLKSAQQEVGASGWMGSSVGGLKEKLYIARDSQTDDNSTSL